MSEQNQQKQPASKEPAAKKVGTNKTQEVLKKVTTSKHSVPYEKVMKRMGGVTLVRR